jgi:hypothetical protein
MVAPVHKNTKVQLNLIVCDATVFLYAGKTHNPVFGPQVFGAQDN